MDEIDEFIDDFLQHGFFDKKKYAREYYLRTRKLVGRKAKATKKEFNEKFNDKSDVKVYDNGRGGRYEYGDIKRLFLPDDVHYKERPDLGEKSRSRHERLEVQQRKLNATRAKLRKNPKLKNRSALEKKLDVAQKKLNQAKNKTKKSFKTKTVDRSGPVVDRKTGRTYAPKTGWQEPKSRRNRSDVGGGKQANTVDKLRTKASKLNKESDRLSSMYERAYEQSLSKNPVKAIKAKKLMGKLDKAFIKNYNASSKAETEWRKAEVAASGRRIKAYNGKMARDKERRKTEQDTHYPDGSVVWRKKKLARRQKINAKIKATEIAARTVANRVTR